MKPTSNQRRRVVLLIVLGVPTIVLAGYLSRRIFLSGGPADQESPEVQRITKLTQAKDTVALRAALKHQDPRVAAAAVEGLASIGGAGAREELEPVFNDPRGQVREAAVAQYGQITDRFNVEPLNQAVTQDPAPAVRAAAAKALGNLRSWNGTDALLRGLSDSDPFVRECSYMAIQRIIGVRYQYDPEGPPAQRAQMAAMIRRDLPKFKNAYDYDMKRQDQKGNR
jgi:hypothetical protein